MLTVDKLLQHFLLLQYHGRLYTSNRSLPHGTTIFFLGF